MINYQRTPLHPSRLTGSVGSAVSQLPAFANVYRPLRDFIDNGGLASLGFAEEDISRWNSDFRPGVIWIGGAPSEINFFEDLMGGTTKDIPSSDYYIEYNSAIDLNIYAENAATGTSGTVTNAFFGTTVNGSYVGAYAQFQIAASQYINNGADSNINLYDSIYIYGDAKWVRVIRVDKTTPFAHQVYVVPFDPGYTINIPAKQQMLPVHVQSSSGYSDINTTTPVTNWETPGYVKRIQPLYQERNYETPRNLGRAWQDMVTFPIIFDTVTGAMLDSFDLKASQDARNDMVMATNMNFFAGEIMKNTAITTSNYTQQYNGFAGYLNELFYGGGNIWNFDPSYGFDLDVDYKQIILQNDAQKLSREYLLLVAKAFKLSMENRAQDMFQANSGACTFQTFERGALGALDATDLTRMGINSLMWNGDTLHIKEVGAWSDRRWVGNKYFPNMGIMMPGTGLTDSNGNATGPIEFWKPTGITVPSGWNEILRDEWALANHKDSFSGTITNTIMMSVNAIENVYAIMPTV